MTLLAVQRRPSSLPLSVYLYPSTSIRLSLSIGRKNTSELIRELVTACGPEASSGLCVYYNKTIETAFDGTSSYPIGPGMKNALWMLSLALLFKIIVSIFTFGIKVTLTPSA